MLRTRAVIFITGMLLAYLCAGCGGKFTRQRYETIYLSMPNWKVREVLGDPNYESSEEWSYVRHAPYYRATIEFDNGKVIDKSWSLERSPEPEEN